MRAVEQWRALEAELGEAWERARLAFTVDDREAVPDAAGVLGPIGAGRVGNELRFELSRRGGGPEKLRNLLGHLDRKRVWGDLKLVDVEQAATGDRLTTTPEPRPRLASSWDAELAKL